MKQSIPGDLRTETIHQSIDDHLANCIMDNGNTSICQHLFTLLQRAFISYRHDQARFQPYYPCIMNRIDH
ncbi:MAG: hypothetical protein PHH59_10790 [Methylovulum sp.]|uniref:hypothetical protein n=1 Tax=Methylovulum sp. TaxID=1916980 RepID=UPI0026335228|nr:hypothetical protein [Methylovulum sp.]MDD2724493.1 hypothetical protein [Methylovulum sp.]MDD5124117.1 hypothetical protein [Methylovulum sp.]